MKMIFCFLFSMGLSFVSLNSLASETRALTSFEQIFSHHVARLDHEQHIHYVRGGDGPPVLLLHGALATWYDWKLMMPALAKSQTVIAIDLPGLGDSSRPPDGYSAQIAADRVFKLIESLKITSLDVVSHDIGTTVGFLLAANHPDLIKHLVLMEGTLPGAGIEELHLKLWPQLWFFDFQSQSDFAESLVHGREKEYLEAAYLPKGQFGRAQASKSDALNEFIRAYQKPGAMRAIFAYYREMPKTGEQIAAFKNRKIKTPVLSIVGGEAMGLPFLKDPAKASIEQLAQHTEYVVIEKCGHSMMQECPHEIIKHIQRYFQKPVGR